MDNRHLHILWTSGDPTTARNMVLMYATNSLLHGWWDEVTVILWGASAPLAVENEAVRDGITLAAQAGVRFTACIACALSLGIKEKLEQIGIQVIPWGQPLTELLQNGSPLLTV